jgi:hypothetical protein
LADGFELSWLRRAPPVSGIFGVAGVLGAEAAAGEPGRFIDHLYPQAYGGEVRIRSQMTACMLDERPARIYLFGEHELDHGHLCPPIAAPIIGLLL